MSRRKCTMLIFPVLNGPASVDGLCLNVLNTFALALHHRNVIHGSDSVESAQKEIYLWFRQNELHSWEDGSSHWIYNWFSPYAVRTPSCVVSLQDGSHHTLHLFGFSSSESHGRRCVIAFLLLFFHRMYFFIWGEMIFFTPQTCTKWPIVSAFIVVSVKSRTLAHVYSF